MGIKAEFAKKKVNNHPENNFDNDVPFRPNEKIIDWNRRYGIQIRLDPILLSFVLY